MPVPSVITDLSTTAASNSPSGSDSPSVIDDHIRVQGAFIAQLRTGAVAHTDLSATGNVTLGDASTDTVTVNGYVGVGGAPNAGYGIYVGSTALTGTGQRGVVSSPTGTSSATTLVHAFTAIPATGAAAFTATDVAGLFCYNPTKGAGSTISNAYGVQIADQTSGTNNYGIYSSVSSGTNKWNIYASGTAANYFAGAVRVGSSTAPLGTSIAGLFATGGSAAGVQLSRTGGTGGGYVGTDGNSIYLGTHTGAVGAETYTERMRIDSTGGVRVGPSGTTGGYLFATNDGTTTTGVSSSGGAGYVGTVSNHPLLVTTNNVERMRIDSSGNVGVGVAPKTWSTGKAVEVGSSGSSVYTAASGDISLIANAYYNTSWKYASTAAASRVYAAAGSVYLQYAASGTADAVLGWTTGLTMDNSGNVGIGVTPSVATGIGASVLEVGAVGNLFAANAATSVITQNAYYTSGYKYGTTNAASYYQQTTGQHRWYTAPSGTAGTAITFTQSLSVGNGTTLALEGATSAAGTGIAFPATQVASSNANTLDDYEEGTWTPTDSSGAALSLTATSCVYTKVGNIVTVSGRVTYPVTADATQCAIGGLPFTSSGFGSTGVLSTATQAVIGYVPNSGTVMNLYGAGTVACTNANMSGKITSFSITYKV